MNYINLSSLQNKNRRHHDKIQIRNEKEEIEIRYHVTPHDTKTDQLHRGLNFGRCQIPWETVLNCHSAERTF